MSAGREFEFGEHNQGAEDDDEDDDLCDLCDAPLDPSDDTYRDGGRVCEVCIAAQRPRLGAYPFEDQATGWCELCGHVTLNETLDRRWVHQACAGRWNR